MLTLIFSLIGYFLIAILVKSYYKLHRFKDPSDIMPEEPYFVGVGWPIYLIYRLVAWPLIAGSRFVEKQMTKAEKKEPKVRVSIPVRDRDLEEAEEEVESMLSKERSL